MEDDEETDRRLVMEQRLVATCWLCLLLFALLCEPVLSKGGRGGGRGSSRGSSRSSGHFRIRTHSTKAWFKTMPGRSSPVRVASAAAAGAAVALTADRLYRSAYRCSHVNSDYDGEDYNRTVCYMTRVSGSNQNQPSLSYISVIIVASVFPRYVHVLENIL
ncbi:shadow of prion protein [Oncorhynchus clarkii lewisi]|uniref:shadow of prion protein n=1 Tax=Oncorhynchus clarkii lewisi TaxID=490388 RepID=UPI0039B85D4F